MIDLLNGVVVHAKKGERSRYLPITSSLTESIQAIDIVKAFMDVYPFKTLYIADLNAIQSLENTGVNHIKIIEKINADFPNVDLWLDAGINATKDAEPWAALPIKNVLGSESFSTFAQYQSLVSTLRKPFTLSLDFLTGGYEGPNVLMQSAQHWPADIIVMTLEKVGANSGVDTQTLKTILAKARHHTVYAAGGVRHSDDLAQLKQLGAKGCLLASALHNKQISTKDLDNVMT